MTEGCRALSRRGFLGTLGAGACLLRAARSLAQDATGPATGSKGTISVHDARWFEKKPDDAVHCQLCPRECLVPDEERGYCGVRENRGGDYHTLVYGAICSMNIDPIEKKPLFHYLPGTTAMSVATAGCNMECRFCQNWQISQFRPEQIESEAVRPEELAEAAKQRSISTLAYTYTEPVIFSEYVFDAAAAGRARGIGSVMISNGFIREQAIRDLCQHLTGIKIDLKAFTEKYYQEQCAAKLAPVLATLDVLRGTGIHLEVVVLLIPTLNDAPQELAEMSKWLVSHLGPDVPLHFSRFHPTYRLNNLPPTPVATLDRARKTAMDAGLHYVYVGNVPFHEGESTYCASCGKTVIHRVGYAIDASNLVNGACRSCRSPLPGIWSQAQALGFKPKPAPAAAPAKSSAAGK